jgi:dienelactone hydrolase
MFKGFKQWLDRWSIKAASGSLRPGAARPCQIEETNRLLRTPELLAPPDQAAQLEFSDELNFTFRSTAKGHAARCDLVHGKLYRAGKSWQSKPLVVVVHGWNAELHYLYLCPRVARALNKRGLNAALIELPFHLHRRPRRTEAMCDFISDDLPGMLNATRQTLADFHALVRWAKGQGCPSVGLWGFSLGAWLAGLYICTTSLADAAALTTPVSNLERAIRELAFCHPVRAALAAGPVHLRLLNLTEYRPKIPAEKILVTESRYDCFVPPETYGELAAAWELGGWSKVPQSHISILCSPKATREIARWLVNALNRTGSNPAGDPCCPR